MADHDHGGDGSATAATPESDLRLARRLAEAAGAAIAPFFRAPRLEADNKSVDGFDPVTAADRASERAIRDLLARERPEDLIIGEEFGGDVPAPPAADRVWVVDPIDGTRAFMTGLFSWGVLIGLRRGGRAALGVMAQPAVGETFFADLDRGGPTLRCGPDGVETALTTRPCARLDEARMLSTDPRLFAPGAERAAYDALEGRVRMTRYGADCYGYAAVAMGTADLVVETGLSSYDIQALIPIVEAAGGVVTDWTGRPGPWRGRIVAAGDARVHEAALKILAQAHG